MDLEKILAKRLPENPDDLGNDVFDPWDDIFPDISGRYAEKSDLLMIEALEAVLERRTWEFIDKHGFLGEFLLYVLAGRDLVDYGTAPRGCWPAPEYEKLWSALIEKWKAYAKVVWQET